MNGAQALIESFKQEQVTTIFGYAGATICPIMDALKDTDRIGYTLVRSEQNAGHMASGYARVSGKVGVCIVTSGPGATNLITGIATAYMDSVPLVAITGQVPSYLLGRDIFQEVDISGAVAPFSKHSYLVKDAQDIPRIVKEAFYIAATGRPGPVLIDIPVDVQQQEIEAFAYPDEVSIRGYRPSVRGNMLQVKRVVETIAQAQRPVFCVGGGVFLADAKQEMIELATRAGIPVVTTMMGLSVLTTDHPLNMGMLGAHGTPCANKALAKADLLILVGCRAADRAILSPEVIGERMQLIHIDVDPAEIGKNIRTAIPLVGDIKTILDQVLELNPTADCAAWLEMLQELRQKELACTAAPKSGTVSPRYFLRALGSRLSADAAICVDVGQNQIWSCKHLWLRGGRFLTSGGLGTMGYALPAAIGVKTAQPDRQTVVICGDGAFQMAMNELAAICAADMDIKIVLFCNGVLGLVNQLQKVAPYRGPIGVSLDGSPDFAAIATAYGILSETVSDGDEVAEAIDRLLRADKSRLLIVKIDPDATTND